VRARPRGARNARAPMFARGQIGCVSQHASAARVLTRARMHTRAHARSRARTHTICMPTLDRSRTYALPVHPPAWRPASLLPALLSHSPRPSPRHPVIAVLCNRTQEFCLDAIRQLRLKLEAVAAERDELRVHAQQQVLARGGSRAQATPRRAVRSCAALRCDVTS
jgi:hypothetical protein